MASKVYIIANFHTFDLSDPEKKYYKIYSNYSFDVKLVGNFSRQFLNWNNEKYNESCFTVYDSWINGTK